jgi:SAM-dependent methyltransferase
MDPKKRFASRVEHYARYRPGYPDEAIATIQAECGLVPGATVADIGSGTGLLAQRFLASGYKVYGVEPNAEMRAAGERFLADFPDFTSMDGAAENTGLPDCSVDLISVGQAFHWFNPQEAKREFQRILREPAWVALVWNERRSISTPFLRSYEEILQTYGTDYKEVNHIKTEEDPEIIPSFFGGVYKVFRFDNVQVFDFDGVKGRVLSSSYAPEPGQPGYEPMMKELAVAFDRYQQDGVIQFEYDTRLFLGQIT